MIEPEKQWRLRWFWTLIGAQLIDQAVLVKQSYNKWESEATYEPKNWQSTMHQLWLPWATVPDFVIDALNNPDSGLDNPQKQVESEREKWNAMQCNASQPDSPPIVSQS